jgi:uncharacterized protein
MARFIRQDGSLTIREAEPGDPIYSQGWTIGFIPKLTSNTSKQESSKPSRDGTMARKKEKEETMARKKEKEEFKALISESEERGEWFETDGQGEMDITWIPKFAIIGEIMDWDSDSARIPEGLFDDIDSLKGIGEDTFRGFLEETYAHIEYYLDVDWGYSYFSVIEDDKCLADMQEIKRRIDLLERYPNFDDDLECLPPLCLFSALNDVIAIKKLTQLGQDPNVPGDGGQTPLMIASLRGHVDAVEMLIEQGADVDAQDESGNTALMIAAENGQLKSVRSLINKGADLNLKDFVGQTAYDRALGVDAPKICDLLRLGRH